MEAHHGRVHGRPLGERESEGLEKKRAEVMAKDQACYFIHDWQEPGDQVRQMIVKDARYGAIKTN
jgi:hypothetical protein